MAFTAARRSRSCPGLLSTMFGRRPERPTSFASAGATWNRRATRATYARTAARSTLTSSGTFVRGGARSARETAESTAAVAPTRCGEATQLRLPADSRRPIPKRAESRVRACSELSPPTLIAPTVTPAAIGRAGGEACGAAAPTPAIAATTTKTRRFTMRMLRLPATDRHDFPRFVPDYARRRGGWAGDGRAGDG